MHLGELVSGFDPTSPRAVVMEHERCDDPTAEVGDIQICNGGQLCEVDACHGLGGALTNTGC